MNDGTAVVRAVTVPLAVETAFRVFVEQFDAIKPREHNLLAVPISETVMEASPGGRILDRGIDGTECVWGEVRAVEQPTLLRFAWFIGPDWQIQPAENASEVEVRFSADGPAHTLVELEHRHLDRHGPGWEVVRQAVHGDAGWPLYLFRYVDLTRPNQHD